MKTPFSLSTPSSGWFSYQRDPDVNEMAAVEAMGKIPEFVQALKENGFDSEPVFD
jgi:hypothetical protein